MKIFLTAAVLSFVLLNMSNPYGVMADLGLSPTASYQQGVADMAEAVAQCKTPPAHLSVEKCVSLRTLMLKMKSDD